MDTMLDTQDFCAITNAELSKLTGVHAGTWGSIFVGGRRPTLKTIHKTAKALGWTEEEVINAIARRQEIVSMNKNTFKKA